MLPGGQAVPRSRSFPLVDKARALAVILREEFGVPFSCYDAANGALVSPAEGNPLPADLGLDALPGLVAEGGAGVTRLPDHRYRMTLVLSEGPRPALVAIGVLPGLGGEDQRLEQQWLRKWLQAVGDRLRLADQLQARRRQEEEQSAQVTQVWEALLALDHLARRLRVHRDPDQNRQRILETALPLLPVQAVVWVPGSPQGEVQAAGELGVSPDDLRHLTTLLAREGGGEPAKPVLFNQDAAALWTSRFPNVHNILAFPLMDQELCGWVLVLNKGSGVREKGAGGRRLEPGAELPSLTPDACLPTPEPVAFRRTDAALLTPFIGLLELHTRASRRYQDMKELLVGLTRSLTSALDAKDTYTFGHSERVARIAVELGRELGLPEDELRDIYLAGLLHDVGKIGVRDSVLSKPDRLTPEEFEHLKQHVTIGYRILADLRPIRQLLSGVLHHHEHYDGAGYPDGLAGEEIPLLARVLAVADAYDAMSTRRPYREAIPYRRIEEILREGAGSQWDPRIIEAFFRCRHKIFAVRQRGVGESLRMALDGALRSEESTAPTVLSRTSS